MDLPVITPEQRKRFEAEYREVHEQVDYTEGENVWCLARAYSERLQLKPYPCQKCGADTVTVETAGDMSLECPKCGWGPGEVLVLPTQARHTTPAQGGSIQQPGGYYGGADY